MLFLCSFAHATRGVFVVDYVAMRKADLKLGRSFGWLNATQFLGALNDNVFKLLVVFFLIGKSGQEQASIVMSVSMIVFVIPFLLLVPFAGKCADRFSKRDIIVISKIAEVAAMLAGCAAFHLGSSAALYGVLFVMCAQSAFFGPSKLGIIPELVRRDQLSRANSFLEAFTFVAIVIGTATAPFIRRITQGYFIAAGLACVVIAAAGVLCSLGIRKTKAMGGSGHASIFFVKDVYDSLRKVWGDRGLVSAVFGSALFMLIGAFLQINLIPYGIETLGLDEVDSAYLFVSAGVGIGIGSYLAGRSSRRNAEFGVVVIGAVGLALCTIMIAVTGGDSIGSIIRAYVLTFFTGLSAGLFVVPIQAFIQLRSPAHIRGEVIAASSFLGWVGVLISAGMVYAFKKFLGFTPGESFGVLGLVTLVLAVGAVVVLGDFLVRFVAVSLGRVCYRISVVGEENVPVEGGCLLVSNHVSWADAVLLSATQQRRIRFVMDRDIYKSRLFGWICRMQQAIPISSQDGPRGIVDSLRAARKAVEAGHIVCIFAEGGITRTGMLRGFRGGLERIMKGSDKPIIPAYIGGAWGSVLSHYYGKLLSRRPRGYRRRISIHFGRPMKAGATPKEIRQAVTELSVEYFDSLKAREKSLGEYFVRSARKRPGRKCVCDSTGKRLRYGGALVGVVALKKAICDIAGAYRNVGVLLPSSCVGVMVNVACTMAGKAAVNLNYGVSQEARDYAVEQCGIRKVITSREFVKKTGVSAGGAEFVFVEDMAGKVRRVAKAGAFLKGWLLPVRMLARPRGWRPDDVATIVFSSGSTGVPKGVMLSHHNIISNVESAKMVFRIYADDDVCTGLPLFHSFGYTITMWLPLMKGVSASYVVNPIDGKGVAESIRREKSSLLFATPTFLTGYMRRAEREDFASLRMVVVGAEKLRSSLSDVFEEKYGIRPVEGYGVTECSPLISVNVDDVEERGYKQVGSKEGTVGHPVPGVAVKIVDVESGADVENGQSGLLKVKGPNVMLGYLGMEKETAEAMRGGWYNTGDIARMDEDGFVTITDRLSRFSKIGGEMVPHMKIEDEYHRGLGAHERVVAVTSLPSETKGEELVVLYDESKCSVDELRRIIERSELENLYRPKASNYIGVESIPVLGSGKPDMTGIRRLAAERREQREQRDRFAESNKGRG